MVAALGDLFSAPFTSGVQSTPRYAPQPPSSGHWRSEAYLDQQIPRRRRPRQPSSWSVEPLVANAFRVIMCSPVLVVALWMVASLFWARHHVANQHEMGSLQLKHQRRQHQQRAKKLYQLQPSSANVKRKAADSKKQQIVVQPPPRHFQTTQQSYEPPEVVMGVVEVVEAALGSPEAQQQQQAQSSALQQQAPQGLQQQQQQALGYVDNPLVTQTALGSPQMQQKGTNPGVIPFIAPLGSEQLPVARGTPVEQPASSIRTRPNPAHPTHDTHRFARDPQPPQLPTPARGVAAQQPGLQQQAPLLQEQTSTLYYYYRPADLVRNGDDEELTMPEFVYDAQGRPVPLTSLLAASTTPIYFAPPAEEQTVKRRRHNMKRRSTLGEEALPAQGMAAAAAAVDQPEQQASWIHMNRNGGNVQQQQEEPMSTPRYAVLIGSAGIIALAIGAMSAKGMRDNGWLSVCMENEQLEQASAYDTAYTIDEDDDYHHQQHGSAYHTFGGGGNFKHDLEKFDV